MTSQQFSAAFKIASDFSRDLLHIDNNTIHGYGLPGFRPVHVTLEMVAKEIRWHALRFDGQWDAEALQEVASLGRRAFIVVS